MNTKFPIANSPKSEFDPLSMYHHTTEFDHKLRKLFAILSLPKEDNLAERFKTIESLLDRTFRLELIHYLHLKNIEHVDLQQEHSGDEESDDHPAHPKILLHFWCLLGCTDSYPYIANYLELSIEEVKELVRELHNTFSIDSLVSRIRQYYENNKHLKEAPTLQLNKERLGIEPSVEPKDTIEDRKQRLRRRYGHLSKVFDLMCQPR